MLLGYSNYKVSNSKINSNNAKKLYWKYCNENSIAQQKLNYLNHITMKKGVIREMRNENDFKNALK